MDVEDTCVVVAFDVAARGLGACGARELAGRLRDRARQVVARGQGLSAALTNGVFASGDPELLGALVANEATDPAVLFDAAALGRPELAVNLYLRDREPWFLYSLRRAVWAAADPADPRWDARDGLVHRLLWEEYGSEGRVARLLPALYAPFPRLLVHALVTVGRLLPPAVLFDRVRRLRELGGRSALDDFVRRAGPGSGDWHGAVAGEPMREPDPKELALVAMRITHRGSDGRLRPALPPARSGREDRRALAGGVADFLAGDLDWDLVRAEIARHPFDDPGTAVFTIRADCPDDVSSPAARENSREVIASAVRVPMELFAQETDRERSAKWRAALRRGLAEGFLDIHRVLAEARPVATVLSCLPLERPEVRRALVAEVDRLGADPDTWRRMYTLVQGDRGSLVEIVKRAIRGSARGGWTPPRIRDTRQHHDVRDIRDGHDTREADDVDREPSAPEAAFRCLLDCAAPNAQRAFVTGLDPDGARRFLRYAGTGTALWAYAQAVHGRSAILARASSGRECAAGIVELLDLDDPEVNELLLVHAPVTRGQCVRILTGTDRTGRPGRIPPSERLLWRLGGIDRGVAVERLWVAAAAGYAPVVRAVLRHLVPRTEAMRLRVPVALCELGRPGEVRAWADEAQRACGTASFGPSPAERMVEAALAVLDDPDGLAELRSRLAVAESPDRLVAELRRSDCEPNALLAEWGPLPWPAVIRAMRQQPLSRFVTHVLMNHPDCPREALLEGLRVDATDNRRATPWVQRGLATGALTPPDIARHCGSAAQALCILGDRDLAGGARAWRPRGDELRAIVAERWGVEAPERVKSVEGVEGAEDAESGVPHAPGLLDAWVVVISLLPDFSGTLLELLDTATAVLAPTPEPPEGPRHLGTTHPTSRTG
ncbi:hypothetical protein [Embleya scabrispora]|uniref:hypothetical protein n=1 Tax=Embleya scabrispora TaxID=159449 RepID=UPI00131A0608|nr:hypothetical protein [Embleya scabrispora]MYS87359.1 hypothetical protein [Streptomyces sp. SID5474]